MKNLKETGIGKILGGKGLYITLGACLLAVGGAGVAAYNHAVSKINDSLTFSMSDSHYSQSSNLQADNKQSGVEKDDESSMDDSSQTVPNTQPNVMPVNGEIINPFSNGELVKSETLGVWKTHDGVDIKADNGTQVKEIGRASCRERV